MGMTMKRSEKAAAQRAMEIQADGYTSTRFESPKLQRQAEAERGHRRMSPAEYIKHRLGRGGAPESQKRERWTEQRIGRRKITKR